MKTKKCGTCGKRKSIKTGFYQKSVEKGDFYVCKECRREKNKKQYTENKEYWVVYRRGVYREKHIRNTVDAQKRNRLDFSPEMVVSKNTPYLSSKTKKIVSEALDEREQYQIVKEYHRTQRYNVEVLKNIRRSVLMGQVTAIEKLASTLKMPEERKAIYIMLFKELEKFQKTLKKLNGKKTLYCDEEIDFKCFDRKMLTIIQMEESEQRFSKNMLTQAQASFTAKKEKALDYFVKDRKKIVN